MNESSSRLLEENLDRLVRRWADPITDEQAGEACRRFVERLTRGEPESPRARAWGAVFIAASLLAAAAVFWAVLSRRDGRAPLPGPVPAAPQDEAPKKAPPSTERLEQLVVQLGSENPDERAQATQEILKIGRNAVPHLKKALAAAGDAEVRARLEILLSDLDLPDPALFYSVRTAGREAPASGGGSRATEGAVLSALKWLARHQNPDGSWSADGFDARCTGEKCKGTGERDYDVGVTGLALLAFLGAGYTELSKDEFPDPAGPGRALKFGQVVKAGLRWLLGRQDREGCVSVRGMKYMYNHAVATAALAEAYGMGAAGLKEPAQRAVDFLVAGQNPGKGWRYSSKCGDNDTSVTGWAVMALKSAGYSSLEVPRTAFDGALAWLGEAGERNGYYAVGYNARGTGKVYVPGKNETFDHHPAMSAIGVVSRLFVEQRKTAPELGAVNLLMADLPDWRANKIDFYYWYYATMAAFQYDGPDGAMWKRWDEAMKKALVPHQDAAEDGCRNGSWNPEVERWGAEGGRVYTTAINALTLEVYYRYPVLTKAK